MHLKHKNTITTAIMQLLLFCKIMVDMQKILFAASIDCLQIEKWLSGDSWFADIPINLGKLKLQGLYRWVTCKQLPRFK